MHTSSYSTAIRAARHDAREQAGYPVPLSKMDADRLAADYAPLVVTFADEVVRLDYFLQRWGARQWEVVRLPTI